MVLFTSSIFDLQVLSKGPFGILMLPHYFPNSLLAENCCYIKLLPWLQKDNKQQRVVQRITSSTTSDSEWSFQLNIFFGIKKAPITKHPKENPLNFDKDLEESLLN